MGKVEQLFKYLTLLQTNKCQKELLPLNKYHGGMKNKNSPGAASLRKKAEEQLQKKYSQNKTSLTSLNKNASGEADYLRLMHELEVHQIELEMQNEELRLAVDKATSAITKFTELYDFAPAGYFTLNHSGVICELNFSGARMLGEDRSMLIGKDFRQFITSDTQSVFTEFFRKVFETSFKQICEVGLSIEGNPPDYLYLEGLASTEEKVCLISAIDITDRKKAEEALRIEEARLRAITMSAQDAILMINPEGNIFFSNQATERIFGYTNDEIIGRNLHALLAPSHYHGSHQKAFTMFQATGQGYAIGKNMELEAKCKDGREISIELSLSSLELPDGWYAVGIIRDVTETKQAKDALQENEAFLNTLLNAIPIPVFFKNRNGQYLGFNKAYESFLGITKEQLIGKDVFDISALELASIYQSKDNELFENGGIQQYDCQVKNAQGQLRDVTFNKAVFTDIRGVASGLIGTILDITESRRQEIRTRKLSEVQAALHDPGTLTEKLKIITDGVVDIFDADFARLWFILPGDQCKLDCMHAYIQDGRHACHNHDQCLHLLASSGRYTHLDGKAHSRVPIGCYKIGLIASGEESMFLTNDVTNDPQIHNHEWAKSLGLVSFAGFQLRPSRGETIGVLALFSKHQISSDEEALLRSFSNLVVSAIQTTQAEDALRESEFFFKESQHAAFIGSYKLDLITGLWESSEVLDQIFGIDRSYKRSVQGWLDITHPDDKEMMDNYFSEEILSKRKPFNKEYRIIRKSEGETRWVLGLGKLDFDAEGKVISMLGTIQDITERKQAEEALRQSEAHLRELNVTKDKFFSIIAHDLRNPFSAIIGFSNLLVEQVQEKDYEGIEEYAGIIKNSSQRALDLLMNLMDWSRTQTGSMKFYPKSFKIAPLITDAVELLKGSARQKSIAISMETSSDFNVIADKALISTILRNLISNAIKFTNPGGTIVVSTEQKQNFLVVMVADNGVGIRKEAIEKLFRIEESYSTAGTQNEEGTGLGLLLCKEFIEKHGCKIWVESELNKGSKFSFTLPLIVQSDDLKN